MDETPDLIDDQHQDLDKKWKYSYKTHKKERHGENRRIHVEIESKFKFYLNAQFGSSNDHVIVKKLPDSPQ